MGLLLLEVVQLFFVLIHSCIYPFKYLLIATGGKCGARQDIIGLSIGQKRDYYYLNLTKRFRKLERHHSEISPTLLPCSSSLKDSAKKMCCQPQVGVVSIGLTRPSGNCSVGLSMDRSVRPKYSIELGQSNSCFFSD